GYRESKKEKLFSSHPGVLHELFITAKTIKAAKTRKRLHLCSLLPQQTHVGVKKKRHSSNH
ncbi:hypothetical protein, partial [Klebsiella pneumoniae]|uniref:hypothetical protein n=1 Tax=Klebsiella pneumoniae TaxID=573 RepID=UPI003B5A90CA